MSLTHSDLKKKYSELQDKVWQRRDRLQEVAVQLLQEYESSLALLNETWTDSDGNEKPYVSLVEQDLDGNYQEKLSTQLEVDGNYKCNFAIGTVIDDSRLSGGGRYVVSICMWYEQGLLSVQVGSGGTAKTFKVSRGEGEGCFRDVSAATKALIDMGLDKSFPK